MNTGEIIIPVSWILSTVGGLAAVIATLASIIYSSLQSRLAAQDKIIAALRTDIDRLSKGCGLKECLWKNRC